jgi:GntR family transcriptional regulator
VISITVTIVYQYINSVSINKKITHYMKTALSKNRLPLHVEISEMLAREIQAGILADGSRLASERLMADELGVAVGTLRKALLELTQKGLLERVQGSGNYVRKPKQSQNIDTIYSFFRLELLKGGGLPTAQVLSVERLNKAEYFPALGPQFGTAADGFRIRRLRRLNSINSAIEEIWIDAPKNRNVSVEDLSDSLYLFYRENLKFWITGVEDQVSVNKIPDWTPITFAQKTSASSLNNEHKIWGYIERKSYDQTNMLAEYSLTWFNPEVARYVARIK